MDKWQKEAIKRQLRDQDEYEHSVDEQFDREKKLAYEDLDGEEYNEYMKAIEHQKELRKQNKRIIKFTRPFTIAVGYKPDDHFRHYKMLKGVTLEPGRFITEEQFLRFLFYKLGPGNFYIVYIRRGARRTDRWGKKINLGFHIFWKGLINPEGRYIRFKGDMPDFLVCNKIQTWNSLNLQHEE